MNTEDLVEKIINVIYSCENKKQLEVAIKYGEQAVKRFEGYTKEALKKIIDVHIKIKENENEYRCG